MGGVVWLPGETAATCKVGARRHIDYVVASKDASALIKTLKVILGPWKAHVVMDLELCAWLPRRCGWRLQGPKNFPPMAAPKHRGIATSKAQRKKVAKLGPRRLNVLRFCCRCKCGCMFSRVWRSCQKNDQ